MLEQWSALFLARCQYRGALLAHTVCQAKDALQDALRTRADNPDCVRVHDQPVTLRVVVECGIYLQNQALARAGVAHVTAHGL